jgi:hypothetical protein
MLILAVVVALALWWWPSARRWLAIDRCLDLGGRWDYAEERCEQ